MSLNQLKRKMQSIKSTAKITNAMALIATTKLKKQRDLYEKNKEYFKDFYRIIGFLLHEITDNDVLNVKGAQEHTLWIDINSTMGLCGAYNSSLNQFVFPKIKPGDYLIQFGKEGKNFWEYQTKISNPIVQFYDFGESRVPYRTCLRIARLILDYWTSGKVNKISISFMRFYNVLTSRPITIDILPFDQNMHVENEAESLDIQGFEFTPEKEELLKSLIPDYVANILYGALIEAKVSEYALRRMAMDAATKNANDLGYQYKLEYNNARQAHITTEIVEIVSSSNALKKEDEDPDFDQF